MLLFGVNADLEIHSAGRKRMPKTKDAYPKNLLEHPTVKIEVQDFGPIIHAEMDLRPLTVFVGKSNTGKTYLASLIYALHRAFDGFSRFPCSDRAISHLKFLYHSQPLQPEARLAYDREVLEILKKLNKPGRPFKLSDLSPLMRDLVEYTPEELKGFEAELKRCFDLTSVSNLVRFPDTLGICDTSVSLKISKGNQPYWSVNMYATAGFETGYPIVLVDDDTVLRSGEGNAPQKAYDFTDFLSLLRPPEDEAERVYYLPAARSGIMQSHGVITSALIRNATRIGLERFPGGAVFSGMISDFLGYIVNYNEHRETSNEMMDIAKALETEVLAGEIEVKRVTPYGYPEFVYRPESTFWVRDLPPEDQHFQPESALRLSQASSMVSELAPLVLFLQGFVRPGDTLIIEEPESHLHPEAQTQVALTLARLVRAGIRVIITTHSDWLLQQIGNLIREGELWKLGKEKTEPESWLVKEEVGAWWFRTNKPITEIPFDRIEGIEPSDYEEVADELYNTFVELERQFLKEKPEDADR